MTSKTKDLWFYSLSALGLLVSILSELEKYSPAIRSLCGGDSGGCSAVAASDYSSFLGISLAIWGVVSYIVLIALYKCKSHYALLFVSLLLGADIYFVYLQFFVIQAICPLCMINFAALVSITAFLYVAFDGGEKLKFRKNSLLIIAIVFLGFMAAHKASESGYEKHVESITSWGDPSSSYRMEVFSDYQCPHCKHNEEVVKSIIANYPAIYIVFRDFIIQGHSLSPMAVRYTGVIAYRQGNEMYLHARFETFDAQESLYTYLSSKYPSIRDDKEGRDVVSKKVVEDEVVATKLKITGTPSTALFKDGKFYKLFRGYVPFEELKPDLDQFVGRSVEGDASKSGGAARVSGTKTSTGKKRTSGSSKPRPKRRSSISGALTGFSLR